MGLTLKGLRLVYSDHISSFDELLKNYPAISIHHKNIRSLAIEIYKYFYGLPPSIVKNVFHLYTNISYSLRLRSELYCSNPERVKFGTETISHLARKIWSLVPEAIKT